MPLFICYAQFVVLPLNKPYLNERWPAVTNYFFIPAAISPALTIKHRRYGIQHYRITKYSCGLISSGQRS
jgi:hypothetical protein